MQILKSDPICWELSRTLDINHFIFEVGSRKSEVSLLGFRRPADSNFAIRGGLSKEIKPEQSSSDNNY